MVTAFKEKSEQHGVQRPGQTKGAFLLRDLQINKATGRSGCLLIDSASPLFDLEK